MGVVIVIAALALVIVLLLLLYAVVVTGPNSNSLNGGNYNQRYNTYETNGIQYGTASPVIEEGVNWEIVNASDSAATMTLVGSPGHPVVVGPNSTLNSNIAGMLFVDCEFVVNRTKFYMSALGARSNDLLSITVRPDGSAECIVTPSRAQI